MLHNIRVILVNTSHPGNIGSSARAMKTMGLSRLVLVQPKAFPSPKAAELAAGADDILVQAQVVTSLPEALAGCDLVIGTSARPRGIPLPALTPRACGEQSVAEAQRGEVAIVFGREHAGLTNDELQHCHYHVAIPSNPEYSSLNLAAAVQVLAYEIRMASQANIDEFTKPHDAYATAEEVERFYKHLEQVLIARQFLNPKSPKRLMPRLRRLFNRIRLEAMEVSILRGILTAIEGRR